MTHDYKSIFRELHPNQTILNDLDSALETQDLGQAIALFGIIVQNNQDRIKHLEAMLNVKNLIDYHQGHSTDCTVFAVLTCASNLLQYRIDGEKYLQLNTNWGNGKGWDHPTNFSTKNALLFMEDRFRGLLSYKKITYKEFLELPDGSWTTQVDVSATKILGYTHAMCMTKIDGDWYSIDNYSGQKQDNIKLVDMDTYTTDYQRHSVYQVYKNTLA